MFFSNFRKYGQIVGIRSSRMGIFPRHEFEVVASKLTKQKGATKESPLKIRWCLSDGTNFYQVADEILGQKRGPNMFG